MAVIAGKVWHRQDKEGYYLVALDAGEHLYDTSLPTEPFPSSLFIHPSVIATNWILQRQEFQRY